MANYEQLAYQIIQSFGNDTDTSSLHNKIATEVSSYLVNNLTMNGTYNGVAVVGGAPLVIPNVQVGLTSIPLLLGATLQTSSLASSVAANPRTYLDAIALACKSPISEVVVDTLTLTPTPTQLSAISITAGLASMGVADFNSGMLNAVLEGTNDQNFDSNKQNLSSIDPSLTEDQLNALTPAFIAQSFIFQALFSAIELAIPLPSIALTGTVATPVSTGTITYTSITIS